MIYEEILLYHFPDVNKQYLDRIAKNQSVISHILKGKSAKIVATFIAICIRLTPRLTTIFPFDIRSNIHKTKCPRY
jgi:hypothetical protein